MLRLIDEDQADAYLNLLSLGGSPEDLAQMQATYNRKRYASLNELLSADVLNIADVVPGEVIELNPSDGRVSINQLLSSCDQQLPAVKDSASTSQPSPPTSPASSTAPNPSTP